MMGERKATMTTTTTKSSFTGGPPPPPPEAEHLPCPRCGSANTKFCYYNNYNFSQPRHFCKSCRRYWTHGGTLRDIPVGGGSRKNGKRSRTSAAATAAAAACPAVGFVPEAHQHHDLGMALAFPFDGTVCGSFTSLLGGGGGVHGQGGGGLLGLAGGFGLEDVAGFEPGRGGVWHFPGEPSNGPGFGVSGQNTWQMESGGDGFGGVDGGDSCFADDLAISTPGSFMKRSEDY